MTDSVPLDVFTRIACGIDGTPQSLDAAQQALALAPPHSDLLLIAGPHRPLSEALASIGVTPPLPDHAAEAAANLERAATELGQGRTLLVGEPLIPSLLQALEHEHPTVVALGSHDHSRIAGIALGSTTTALLHDAPCSILVARPSRHPDHVPRRIALGYDGSPQARQALAAASALAHRTGATLHAIIADATHQHDLADNPGLPAHITTQTTDEHAADALIHSDADLIIVGSRGLHGLRSLGSVSERVAHHAHTSVLVIRSATDHDTI